MGDKLRRCEQCSDPLPASTLGTVCLLCRKGLEPEVVLSFRYNGDYPGYPCVRLGLPEEEGSRWLTPPEEAALCSLFGVRTLGQLYDLAGAMRSGDEHAPFVARLSLGGANETDHG